MSIVMGIGYVVSMALVVVPTYRYGVWCMDYGLWLWCEVYDI